MALKKASNSGLRSMGTHVNVIAVLIVAISVLSVASFAAAGNGNGAPSGPHYNLNIIGVEKGGSESGGSNGHVIFVPLYGNCKIMLQVGNFQVVQPNCLEGNAEFLLPNPAPSPTATSLAYSVWIRALTPQGSALMTTCFTDPTPITGGTFCNAGTLVVPLSKVTPPKFTDVSKQLLQACVGGSLEPIFKGSLFTYFWYYQDTGLRLAQLRFYPISTTPIGGGCTSTTLSTS
jgi:hypothetical protein